MIELSTCYAYLSKTAAIGCGFVWVGVAFRGHHALQFYYNFIILLSYNAQWMARWYAYLRKPAARNCGLR